MILSPIVFPNSRDDLAPEGGGLIGARPLGVHRWLRVTARKDAGHLFGAPAPEIPDPHERQRYRGNQAQICKIPEIVAVRWAPLHSRGATFLMST